VELYLHSSITFVAYTRKIFAYTLNLDQYLEPFCITCPSQYPHVHIKQRIKPIYIFWPSLWLSSERCPCFRLLLRTVHLVGSQWMNRFRWVLKCWVGGNCVGCVEISEGTWQITAVGEDRADWPKDTQTFLDKHYFAIHLNLLSCWRR
jgi:hypothetical protein